MNFKEWWSEYNREQIFYQNYSHDTSIAIKALAEEAFNAGRDAWREVVSRDAPLTSQSSRPDNAERDLIHGCPICGRLSGHDDTCKLPSGG